MPYALQLRRPRRRRAQVARLPEAEPERADPGADRRRPGAVRDARRSACTSPTPIRRPASRRRSARAERAHFYKWLIVAHEHAAGALIVYFYPERWADDAAGDAQVKAHAEAHVGALLDQLDAQLARHGGPWLLGATISAADPYAFMLCRWTRGFAPAGAQPAAPRPLPAAHAGAPGGAARARTGTAGRALRLTGAPRPRRRTRLLGEGFARAAHLLRQVAHLRQTVLHRQACLLVVDVHARLEGEAGSSAA